MHLASLMHHRVALRSQGTAQRQAFVQLAHLAEVDHAQRISAANRAFGRVNFAAQQAQKRGFAAAVGADQPHFHARGEDEVEPGEQPLVVLTFWTGFGGIVAARHVAGYILEFDQPFGLALTGVKVDAGSRNRSPRVDFF